MASFYSKKDLKNLYNDSKTEAHEWRSDYPAYERLANNDLMEGLDSNLPEVNDGSLSAALFKLPKRVYRPLTGSVKAIDRDEAWLSELANLQWRNEIVPNANMQAPFDRKWKDAIRKAAIYGSVPLITLATVRDGKDYTDFLVGQPQDVTLEPGKVSDYDSDVIFWDVYYTKIQLENMIEEAKAEKNGVNKWNVSAMQKILDGDFKEERSSLDTPRQGQTKNTRPKGFKFCIAFQRGVDAPFYMYHKETDSTIREWKNPDPTGDVPIHFLYCYQDFINPYGIGIVKLAGGTQNVLDYMRQADVLATQLGLRPPIEVQGDVDSADLDSMVYAQDALWLSGQAKVTRMELANGVYNQIPARIAMYNTSLQKMIPMGDTSASGTDSGDPQQSKTPAGVKLQAANLSIDDEDFKDNLYVTYEAVARSMLNTHFANMEGEDLMKLSDDERELLMKAGFPFEPDENGELPNQLEIVWDTVRAQFNYEVDPEADKVKEDADKLEGLTKVYELSTTDPTFVQDLMAAGKKFNKGELMSEMIALTSDNDKIITDISPEEKQQQEEQPPVDPNAPEQKTPADTINYKDLVATGATDAAAAVLEEAGLPSQGLLANGIQQAEMQQQAAMQPELPVEAEAQTEAPSVSQEEVQANVDAVMQEHGVDEATALTMLAAEHAGLPIEDILAYVKGQTGVPA